MEKISGPVMVMVSEPLVASASHQGRHVTVTTYYDGRQPVKATLVFRTSEDARECARILNQAIKPT